MADLSLSNNWSVPDWVPNLRAQEGKANSKRVNGTLRSQTTPYEGKPDPICHPKKQKSFPNGRQATILTIS